MKVFLRRGIFGLLSLVGFLHASDHPILTLAQYGEQLQSYESRIQELSSSPQNAVAMRDSIPASVIVQTSRGNLEVNTEFIRDELNRFLTVEAKARAPILSDLSARLHLMRTEAASYDQPSLAGDAMRKRLDQILSTSEFNRVRGPSSLELLKQRIGAWILKQFRKLNPSVPDLQNAGQIFVWTMIALASIVVAIWLYRLSRETMSAKREIVPFMPSSRSWHEWLSQARQQAAQGRWRDAVHFGFWAAVSRLEAEGVWPPDKARTPREYLRAIPASNPSKEPFSALTGRFEASWYGARPTTEADFTQFSSNLERLGCR